MAYTHWVSVIEHFDWNKSSLFLKIQVFRVNLNRKVFTKVIKMPRWKAWMKRPVGLIINGRKPKHLRR